MQELGTPLRNDRGSDTAVFARVLALALDRLFVTPPAIEVGLLSAPSDTLFQLSHAPEAFGELRNLAPTQRSTAVMDLLTAARAFVVATRRSRAGDSSQLNLPLL